MKNSTHISLETLADIAENRATGAVRETAIAHVITCTTCADTLRRLQLLIGTMRTDETQDAPRDVMLSAINIFTTEKRPSLRRIVATLIFDSRHSAPAFGLRSVHTTSRQLLYEAEQADLDLRVTVQNEECTLAGQVIGDACEAGLVEISGAAGSAEARLNELCEFTLPAVPAGNYSLRIRMADVEIEIPDLELKG